jgi:putative SOS response-associated peptidase YedK
MFRSAFKRNRCLIPVSGYYEWQDTPGGKQPWYFTAKDGSPALTIAGLWDEWKDKASGETLKSCTMIITKPNKFVSEVHDRMPVLLGEEDYEPWLSGKAGLELLKPAAENVLQRWPGSRYGHRDATMILCELTATPARLPKRLQCGSEPSGLRNLSDRYVFSATRQRI